MGKLIRPAVWPLTKGKEASRQQQQQNCAEEKRDQDDRGQLRDPPGGVVYRQCGNPVFAPTTTIARLANATLTTRGAPAATANLLRVPQGDP